MRRNINKVIYVVFQSFATVAVALILSCARKPVNVTQLDALPDIYPDYKEVTVPVNIAPLNFLIRGDSCDALNVVAECNDVVVYADCESDEVTFDMRDWKRLMSESVGCSIRVTVSKSLNGEWVQYKPFHIMVSSDSIDSYLTYRMIEPDYEVYSRLRIVERCVENFWERSICDYESVGNRCMNCHTYNSHDSRQSFLYVRGEGGGMILNQNGNLRKLALKTEEMVSGSVYAQFSPNGRWLVFSTNKIIPAFHARPSKRLEVFDTKSDIYIADMASNKVVRNPLLADSTHLETFPTFSSDGKIIYFCSAERLPHIGNIDSLQYDLCRVSFDERTGEIGDTIETLIKSKKGEKQSVCHPRVSPDGEFLLYTVADYGTFPIWHPEADLQMMNLRNSTIYKLESVNSSKSDTYHSWSSNSRWFVFASKRDDGSYGKLYFCHIDDNGTTSKPFVLPQESPSFYDYCLKSFNVPEMGKSRLPFTPEDVAYAIKSDAESF